MRTMSNGAYRLLHDGIKTLAKIEHNGIRIDVPYLEKTLDDTAEQIRGIESVLRKDEVWRRWRKRFGDKANLGSGDQLGKMLFGKKKYGGLGYEASERTSTKKASVKESSIEQVGLSFCKEYVKWKRLLKARNTFLEGIRRELVGDRIHPSYSYHLTESYRTSCSNPPLHQMPVRNSAIGKLIRKCFIASPGHRIVEVDFSQIEVRIAACYCKDPNLIQYIEDKTTDMHYDAAARLLMIDREQISKQVRHVAKNKFVFPQFYGSYYVDCAKHIWDGLARENLKLVDSETTVIEHLAKNGIQSLGRCDPNHKPVRDTFEYQVKQTEDWFWQVRFKHYTAWKKWWWQRYLRRGFFRSKFGFFYGGGVFRRNQVLNIMIQGDASNCNVWCMNRLQEWLTKNRMRTKIVNEIHDSQWYDAYEPELQDVLHRAHEIMTVELPRAFPWIIVPIETETEVAPEGGSIADKQEWIVTAKKWGLK